jgi:hypothetical protein
VYITKIVKAVIPTWTKIEKTFINDNLPLGAELKYQLIRDDSLWEQLSRCPNCSNYHLSYWSKYMHLHWTNQRSCQYRRSNSNHNIFWYNKRYQYGPSFNQVQVTRKGILWDQSRPKWRNLYKQNQCAFLYIFRKFHCRDVLSWSTNLQLCHSPRSCWCE